MHCANSPLEFCLNPERVTIRPRCYVRNCKNNAKYEDKERTHLLCEECFKKIDVEVQKEHHTIEFCNKCLEGLNERKRTF